MVDNLCEMEKKSTELNKILEEFLKGEADATDLRILAIRHFLVVLNESVEKYVESKPEFHNPSSREKLAEMIDGMAEIYREEASSLLVKRGKIQEYISFVQKRRAEEGFDDKTVN